MVSIIIPVYNTSQYLQKCLNSCFSQTYKNIEILAINDGSKDNSLDILKSLQLQDSRLKIFDQKNAGVVAARNVGITNAQGDWLVFLDSDDTLAHDAIEVLLDAALANSADIAVANFVEVYNNTEFVPVCHIKSTSVVSTEVFLQNVLAENFLWGICGKIFRRSLFNDLVLVPFTLGEDGATLVQVVVLSNRIALSSSYIYHYYQRSTSAVHKKNNPKLIDVYRFRVWIGEFLYKNGFNDSMLIERFILNGYIWCLFQGGKNLFLKDDYQFIKPLYKRVEGELKLWQKIVYFASQSHFLYLSLIPLLRYIKKGKSVLCRL